MTRYFTWYNIEIVELLCHQLLQYKYKTTGLSLKLSTSLKKVFKTVDLECN